MAVIASGGALPTSQSYHERVAFGPPQIRMQRDARRDLDLTFLPSISLFFSMVLDGFLDDESLVSTSRS